MLISFWLFHFFYFQMRVASFLSLTTEWAAGVDARRPHVRLIRVAEGVVDGDEDADGRTQKAQDQQAHDQNMQDHRGVSYADQRSNH